MKKTKNTGENTHIPLEGILLEKVDNYIYLCQEIRTKRDNKSDQITRRIRLG